MRLAGAAALLARFVAGAPPLTAEERLTWMDTDIQAMLTSLVALLPTLPLAQRAIQPVISPMRRNIITLTPTSFMGVMVTMNQKQHERMLVHARKDGHEGVTSWLTTVCALRSGKSSTVLSAALLHLATLQASPDPDVSAAARAWRRSMHKTAA